MSAAQGRCAATNAVYIERIGLLGAHFVPALVIHGVHRPVGRLLVPGLLIEFAP